MWHQRFKIKFMKRILLVLIKNSSLCSDIFNRPCWILIITLELIIIKFRQSFLITEADKSIQWLKLNGLIAVIRPDKESRINFCFIQPDMNGNFRTG